MDSNPDSIKEVELAFTLKLLGLHYFFLGAVTSSDTDGNEGKRILFITKFPPIVGGVASQEYWRARELVKRGYEVFVITNANETEAVHRSSNWTESDLAFISYMDKDSGGFMRTYFVDPSYINTSVNKAHRHIPMDRMSQSKLVGLAIKLIEKYKPSLILSSYLEPYGCAAIEAGGIMNLPVYLNYAGSDMERLATVPELGWKYHYTFKNSTRVGGTWDKANRLLAMGVKVNQIIPIPLPTVLPEDLFCRKNLQSLYNKLPGELVVGIYGKYSRHKCVEQVLQAAKLFKESGNLIKVLCLLLGDEINELQRLVEDMGITECVVFMEALPPWKIPDFLSSLDAGLFLEHDFPLRTHAPITPLEASLCEAIPVLSEEMQHKLRTYGFEDRVNCIVVKDPTSTEELLNIYYLLMYDPQVQKIRSNLQAISQTALRNTSWDDYERTIECLSQGKAEFSQMNSLCITQILLYFFPVSLAILADNKRTQQWIQDNLFNLTVLDALNIADQFSAHLAQYSLDDWFFRDAVMYERARITSMMCSKQLDIDSAATDPGRMLMLASQDMKPSCSAPNPVIIEMNTDLYKLYDQIHHGKITIRKMQKHHVLITCSTEMNPQGVKMTASTGPAPDKYS